MKYLLWLIRIIIGLVFIFSGLVKANDPLGLVYKMDEFFEVLHLNFMVQYSFVFSLVMIAFEILCGVAVLFGYAFRTFSFLLLLLNIFFTFLTGYALATGKVKECGCFGACIKISSSATFYKDIVLTILSVFLFVYRKQIHPLLPKHIGTALITITLAASFFVQWMMLQHLPYIDCLPYKVGYNLWQKMQVPPGAIPDKYESVMIYQKDGVKKEFNMQNYPWQDTTWKFVDRIDKLVQKGNAEPEIRDFSLTDYSGGDHTQEILTAKGYQFLWFLKDPATANLENMDVLHSLIKQAQTLGIPFYVICSANKADAEAFQKNNNLMMVDFLVLDLTIEKTAMRSNPGLMLLNNGFVEQKWSFKDYPHNISLSNTKLIYK
jgi:uncharacterized membrane protein YphA (DoxX/SURF4 family)